MFLVSCDDRNVGTKTKTKEGCDIIYQTVVIDGNEYYATRTKDGWYTLCPKLPPKAEK